MRRSILAMTLIFACAAAPVYSADSKSTDKAQTAKTDENQAAAADQKADKNRKVCKVETSTGSVMPKRVCRTVAEIEAQQEQAAATKEALAQQH